MITIAELFPLYKTAFKWFSVFRETSSLETVRLEKEYTIHTLYKGHNFLKERWDVDGKLHRTDGPAIMVKTIHKTEEIWCIDGKRHKIDGPALVRYFPSGHIWLEEWYFENKEHREENKMSSCQWYENGKLHIQGWSVHGKWHRTDGPAFIVYDEDDGSIIKQSWWIEDVQVDKES